MTEPGAIALSEHSAQKSGQRAQQRAALQKLIDLAAEAATAEVTMDQRHATTLIENEKWLGKRLFDINQHFESRERATAEEFAQRTTQVRTQYASHAAELTAADTRARQKLDYDNERTKQDIGAKLQQAVWLAESVFEATQNQIAKELKKAKEIHAARNDELDGLTRESAVVLSRYGRTDLIATVQPSEPTFTGLGYDERLLEVKQFLSRLDRLAVPNLFVGLKPFLAGILLLIAGAGVGQVIAAGVPSNLASIQPNGPAIGYGLGAAAVVSIFLGLLLYSLGKRQVLATYTPLINTLETARATSEKTLEEAKEERDRKTQRAQTRKDIEISTAKDKVAPIQKMASEKYAAGQAAIQKELSERAAALDIARHTAETAANEWQTHALTSAQGAQAKDLEKANGQHMAAMSASEKQLSDDRTALELKWNIGLTQLQSDAQNDDAADEAIAPESAAPFDDYVPTQQFSRSVRFGGLHIDLQKITDKYPKRLELPASFTVPATLSFPEHGSLMIHTDHAGRADAIRLEQAVMGRLLLQVPPGKVRFTIIDPVGLGQNFAGFMRLNDFDEALVGTRIWTEAEHIEQQLANLTEHMETVIQKYLRNEFATIDEYNAQAGELAEPYRVLVISDFPINFEADALRRLNSIATSGARCGVYYLIVRDTRVGARAGLQLEELESNAINLERVGERFVWRDPVFRQFPLELAEPPSEAFFTSTLDQIGAQAKKAKRVEVAFDAIAPKADEIWSLDSASEVVVPIGRLGATRRQMLKLGRGVAQHALIAGKTGSGKSTLLHVMITNLALWYAPDQLEFYLVDFKKGVEFKTYATHHLPHARAVAVESDREFGLSLLQRIDAELSRRGELFRKLGVQDLASFRSAAPDQPMPRTLLIIDEFQEFFSEDDKLAQEAGLLLDRLVRQGRAFGVHVLLGSQTIGGSSGLARSTIGQMAVRIALQTSEADSQLILGDSNIAARLLSRPGESIYNDNGGAVEANSPFQISWLAESQREQLLAKLDERNRDYPVQMSPAMIFEGNSPADISKNRQLVAALRNKSAAQAGPLRIWLGDPVAIKEPTAVSLRQQSAANLIIIGQNDDASLATLAAALVSISAQRSDARILLLDGTPADSVLAGKLPRFAEVLPSNIELVEWRAVDDAIVAIAAEVKQRLATNQIEFTPTFLVIAGLQRYRMLRKSEDSFSSFSMDDEQKKTPPDKAFAEILRDGGAVGVHVIASIDTAASIDRTLDRGAMREFDQRILFQMSATDSSNLIDSPAANRLGFYRALLYSEEQGTFEKFRPYALFSPQWVKQQQT